MGLFTSKDDKKKEHLESAQKFIDQGETTKAFKELQKALEIDPDCKEAHTAMAFLYSDMGQQDNAIEIFRKVISIDNNSSEAWNNLGLFLARAERYQESIKTFEDAISRHPKVATYYNNLGNVYYELGQYAQAMQVFQIAMDLDPSYADSYNRLGIDKDTTGNMEVALRRLEEASKSGKNKAKTAFDMGTLYAKQELLDKAIKSFQEAIRLDPRFEGAFMALGFAYEKKGDLQKALETFGTVITLNPQSAKVHNTVGLILDKLRLYKQAINEYRIAIKLEPSYNNAHFILGQVYENKGITQKAIGEFEKYIRIHEKGAMVEEAKSRIARLKNISIEEVDRILDMKKDDAPTLAQGTEKSEAAPKQESGAATTAEIQEKFGVKLTDPKEYLKQMLAKAKAAKTAQMDKTNAPGDKSVTASLPAGTTPNAKVSSTPTVPAKLEAPSGQTAQVSRSEASDSPAPRIETKETNEEKIADLTPTSQPAPSAPPSEEPISKENQVISHSAPVFADIPLVQVEKDKGHHKDHGEQVLDQPPSNTMPIHFEGEDDTASSIPVYSPGQPIPASALDGYLLDEHEVLEAIVRVDTQNVEQEAQVLEAVEAIQVSKHASEDELLEDPIPEPIPPVPLPSEEQKSPPAEKAPPPPPDLPSKINIKRGFF